MNELLGTYKNGNYTVTIFADGTKIRANKLDFLKPSTIESADVKITNSCDIGCAMCHENSTPDGLHGDIMSPSFLDNLHPYTELAIGGGNPLCHPDLIPFLEKCKKKKFIPSMTINQIHFERDFDLVKSLVDKKLIYGLGISLVNASTEFIQAVKQFDNAVIHIINGMIMEEQLNRLAFNNLKILILGYKVFRRGETLYNNASNTIEARKTMLKELLPCMINNQWFNTISFDNLAINQLNVRTLMSEDQWKRFYMGDDGIDGSYSSASMFVDMVKREYAINSCSTERYPLMNTVEEMFNGLHK